MIRRVVTTANSRRRRAPLRVLAGLCSLLVGFVLLPLVAGASIPAPPLYSGGPATSAPVLFILCNWGGFSYHPNSLAYYKNLWTTPTSAGFTSLADYWQQVSFGQTNVNGSTVLNGTHSIGGWYPMSAGASPVSLLTYAGYGGGGSPTRIDKILGCMDAASADLTPADLTTYQSIVTVTPFVQATAPNAINNGDTTIQLSSVAGWPTASFDINYTTTSGSRNYTNVQVSSINTATKTLVLAAPWSLGPVGAGALITTNTSDDVGWVGPQTISESGGIFNNTGSGTSYQFGIADLSAGDTAHGSVTNGVGDGAHEIGHSFGYNHSRAMATSITDYYDCWDQMSYNACGDASPSTEAAPTDPVVGMDAIDLENQGWIPAAAKYHYQGGQHTIKLHALSDPKALSGNGIPLLDAHIPAVVTIEDNAPSGFYASVPPQCSGSGYHCDSSDYFTVEYRQGIAPGGYQTWDYGAGAVTAQTAGKGAVVLHLHTPVPNPGGGNSFEVNTNLNASSLVILPNNGALAPSLGSPSTDEFVDTATNTYVAVNAINTSTWTATVTISSTPIANAIAWTGATTATYGQNLILKSRVTVAGSGAPVPNVQILMSVADGLGCFATTGLNGFGSCTVSMIQPPGSGPSYNADTEFTGDAAYGGIYGAPVAFTVKKAPLTVTANKASKVHGTANPSLTANLTGFVLGQTLATSDVTGSAKCTTTAKITSPAGSYPITCTVGTLASYNYSFAKFVSGVLTVT
ncbi:MAG: MBG domain-containing protein [Acidimicrobiales bacterium]